MWRCGDAVGTLWEGEAAEEAKAALQSGAVAPPASQRL